jgi:hypothetical protein
MKNGKDVASIIAQVKYIQLQCLFPLHCTIVVFDALTLYNNEEW